MRVYSTLVVSTISVYDRSRHFRTNTSYLASRENLINFLLQFGDLNQQQIDLIKSKVKSVELKKEAYFSEAGKTAKEVAFVDEGILSVCCYTDKGQEITRYFIDENNVAVDLNSFTYKTPSSEYVQAVTDCNLLVFTADALTDLSATIIPWDSITSRITARSLMEP